MPVLQILIGGTSHTGKSTLAADLGKITRWPVESTDDMARHPGRPWPDVRPQVAEFYQSLSPATVHWFLKVHHENMWPLIRHRLETALGNKESLIVEGSALRPDRIADLQSDDVFACLLHASPERLTERMHIGSDYWNRDRDTRMIIDRFLERSIRDGKDLHKSARQHGLPIFDAEQPDLLAVVLNSLAQRSLRPNE
ncbi:hypothetical protein [Rhizobium oryzicola]|uniref:Adenylate kinase n=1 Tax=Rhizobium oryzicola TaxID=1232668 RepID=A0ABT8SZL4_9HYPH|nr:hypothetical protein [Rhizobium oryzicola]MDO1583892.1 hypothetical protein [Rhizobium oryzicola]